MEHQKLEKNLGYIFRDPNLLKTALTHRSVSHINNERLEYLGDSIVNFIIAEKLYQTFPQAHEGQLSRMRASLVKKESLACIGRDLDLGEYVSLGSGELKSGGFRRESILADTVEAIIAAIHLDSDLDSCKQCILNWFHKMLQEVSPEISNKDFKTQLQEYVQARKLTMPQYDIIRTEGKNHNQTFYVSCKIESIEKIAEGKGNSRRRAEQMAAERLLEEIDSE